MAPELLIGLFIGLLAGLAIGWLAAGRKSAGAALAMEAARAAHQEEKSGLQRQLEQAQQRADGLARELSDRKAELAAEQERARHAQLRLDEQKVELERLQERMAKEFEAIANRVLEQRGKALSSEHQEKLGLILKPLQDRIGEFQRQVQDAYDKEGRERFALKQEIGRLVEQNQRLSQEADNLTKALKGDTQAQGAWGEMLLEKLLESSGLVKGQEYSMQESTTLSDGSRLRPDAVVLLPDEKHLVIDSKVSLLHYERFTATNDEGERARLLKQHIESLRAHAKGLADKDYSKLYGLRSVDFVLMFVPLEPAFLLALRERPDIFQEAYDRGVVMVTHTTLMATLRTVHGLWKSEHIARNHQEIAERAGKLYEKFVGFTDDLIKVGQQMDLAKRTYSEAMGKLSDGAGNLVRQVELLKQLGAKSNKSINAKLLERSQHE